MVYKRQEVLFAAIDILLRGLGASMMSNSERINNGGLSSFYRIVFAVQIHEMSKRLIGS